MVIPLDAVKSRVAIARQFVQHLTHRYKTDGCRESAAALTYMSLFALVPLLTVLYTIASAIPAFQGLEVQLQGLLFEHLVPDSSSDIQGYLNDFSQQAKTLTGPGIAFLFVTAVLMLRNIEKAFNQIWRARKHRSAISSFLLYWAVLTLGPITIGNWMGVIVGVGGSVGTVLGGRLVDTLGKERASRGLRVSVLVTMASFPLGVYALLAESAARSLWCLGPF